MRPLETRRGGTASAVRLRRRVCHAVTLLAALLLWRVIGVMAESGLPSASDQPGPPPAISANVEQLETRGAITRYRLKSNGMTLYLAPNATAPVITFLVVYHVGSRHEAPGYTGATHLLEHLLFNKSTSHFGKANGHKTFQEVLYEAGADFSATNMTTWYDRMSSFSTLPADKLALAMQIEADRLGRGLILDAERQTEMTVVRNEYEIGENTPAQALSKAVIGAAIVAHPYHWPHIGYRTDIEGVSTAKLREHYQTFFWPNNAEAILVGDFPVATALALFDREFGSFAPAPAPLPQVVTVEPPQEGERRVVVQRPGQVGLVQIAHLRPGALDPDFLPLEVLARILGDGVNSRLYQALVETGLASTVSAVNFALRDPYPLLCTAVLVPGTAHQHAEEAFKSALAAVAQHGVSDIELQRAQRQIEGAVIRSRDGTYPLAHSLGEALASASWEWWDTYLDRLQAVTRDDVQRVAARYLVPEHATVGWFVPTALPEPPAVRPSEPPASANHAGERPMPSTVVPAPPTTPAGTRQTAQPFGQRTQRHVLGNGVILDIVENHTAPTVALSGLVFAGGMTAPSAHPALPRLTAMMLARGTSTQTKQALAARLDGAGARLHIEALLEEVTITGSALARDVPLLLETLADVLQRPIFAADELVKAKAELKTTLLRAAENTSQRAFERLVQRLFPAGHPYRVPTTEAMLSSLEALTRADLVAFHQERYHGASLILTIVGDVDAAETAALVDRLFGTMPTGTRPHYDQPRLPPPTLAAAPTHAVVTLRGKASMNLVYGAASGLRRTDPDYEAALIANAAFGGGLSSRLGKRIRDAEGLSYTPFSQFALTDVLDGVWMVNVPVAPANLAQALISTRDEIATYCREGVTDAEVENQKQHLIGRAQVLLGTNAGMATALKHAEKFGYGPAYLDAFPERIRQVTRAQVNQAITAHLRPDALHLVVAGDLDTLPAGIVEWLSVRPSP